MADSKVKILMGLQLNEGEKWNFSPELVFYENAF